MVTAIESLTPKHGASQPWLMIADDGRRYIVKFADNPFGSRILVNEFLGARLVRDLGLAVPDIAVVRVREGLGVPPGLHFGSRMHTNLSQSLAHEWLPEPAWKLVSNPEHLIGAYVFDLWTGNVDHRQVIFTRLTGLCPFTMRLIDHGHCFGGPAWRLVDVPILVPPTMRFAYRTVTGWPDLEPWLTRIEQLPEERIAQLAAGLPPEWLGAASDAFSRLLDALAERRRTVRELIANALSRGGHPFACWRNQSGLFAIPCVLALGQSA